MLPASPIRAKLAAMREIRKETRNPEKLQVLLSQMAEPLLAESGSTDNVSSHGMPPPLDAWLSPDSAIL